ncbi:MAG: hypothetical protein AB1515_10420 [Nitrospirota bacterium]
MKWALALALLAAAGWAGYEWLNDVMTRETLGSAIEAAIEDPRARGLEQIRAEIRDAARRAGIDVGPEAIELALSASDRQPIAGQMAAQAGLMTSAQRITARVRYERRVWGRPRTALIERSKVYIAAAAPAPGPQDRLLGQIP